MTRTKIFLPFLVLIPFIAINAQSPAPIIVQPANAPAAKSTSSTTTAAAVSSISEAIKTLEQIKAGNAEVLGKQKAALQKLEELQDAADQLRIFAKRG